MRQIVAIIKPYLAEKLIQAIVEKPIEEISIREVKGYGRQKSYLERYSENEYSLAFVPKVEISVWVNDDYVEEIVEQIQSISRTGRLGDGKILVLPVLQSREINF